MQLVDTTNSSFSATSSIPGTRTVTVISDDTDAFVLLLYHYNKAGIAMPPGCDTVACHFGVGKGIVLIHYLATSSSRLEFSFLSAMDSIRRSPCQRPGSMFGREEWERLLFFDQTMFTASYYRCLQAECVTRPIFKPFYERTWVF